MMKQICNLFKKYKMILISTLLVLVIGILGLFIFSLFINSSSLKTIDKKYYNFEYDKSWKIDTSTDNSIILKHNSKSQIDIKIINLESEYQYSSIDDLIDEILYNLEQQNEQYKLLSKKEDLITKNQFNGYKMLFEKENYQVMVTVFKKANKLVMITYEAENEYFDILLDSVHNIIYNFNTKEETFNLTNELNLEVSNIEYSINENVENLLKDTSNYEIANNNYYVNYSIPSNFKLNSIDSTDNSFKFEGLESGNSISLSVSILNRNIYEYLGRDDGLNLYSSYKVYQENEDYSEFKESVSKLKSNYDSYVYKNSYYYDKAFTYNEKLEKQEYKRKNENIILIYALNPSHILTIKISSTGTSIPEKMIDMIKINSSKNYASYIKIEKDDNNLLGELKRFTDYNRTKLDVVSLKIPDKYVEITGDTNIYENRTYGFNYNEEQELYDYEIEYKLTNSSAKIDGQIELINLTFSKAYGTYNYLKYSGEFTLNSKVFKIYSGGYTNLGGIMFTDIDRIRYYVHKKVLFYELSNGGYLIIEISGNGKEISDEMLNEATNFEITEETY